MHYSKGKTDKLIMKSSFFKQTFCPPMTFSPSPATFIMNYVIIKFKHRLHKIAQLNQDIQIK